MPFQDIIGHGKQIALLKNYMAQNRIPHALLFHGIEGVGKKMAALTFAKALNCLMAANDACDACSSCRKADHGNHLDIVTTKAEGQFIKIQAVRNLQEQLKFKPWEGKKRICIIDEAEKMNDAAANTLLKTLEEPPSANIIILVSAQPHQLPATILSRCQQIRFNPIDEESLAACLEKKLLIDSRSAHALASSSGGSMARALEMHSGSFLSQCDELMEVLGNSRMDDPLVRLSLASRFGDEREAVLERLDILRMCYRDVLFYKETGKEKGLINSHRLNIIRSLAERMSVDDLMGNFKIIDRTRRAVEQHADKTLTLEIMMLRIAP